jgi:glucose/arabinose dehydrogenase
MNRHTWGRPLAGALAGLFIACSSPAALLKATKIVGGINYGTFACAAPGDTARLFVLEQETGQIRILDLATRQFLATPFLTVDGIETDIEAGLLGMAFHPQYPDSPYFYVDYNGPNFAIVVARYTVSGDPNVALANSRKVILSFASPQHNHNGGWLGFGPDDGYLYISVGDGGGSGDNEPGHDPLVGNAQSDTTRRGKILRIDVDGGSPYVIPPSNPFFGSPSPKNEFWMKGLRNPWRCSIDRENGDLYVTDVGQALFEEIDYQPGTSPGGENLGWRKFEGYQVYDCPDPCDSSGLTRPIHVYGHNDIRCAVTGGYVYRGQAMPSLRGTYFFADYCSDQVWSFRIVNGQVTEFTERTADLHAGDGADLFAISSFAEDAKGELYMLTSRSSGDLFKIEPDPSVLDTPRAVTPAALFLGPAQPNPGTGDFVFRASALRSGRVSLAIHDINGRRVRTLLDEEGPLHKDVVWDGRDQEGERLHPGLYFARLVGLGETHIERVSIVR